MYKKHNQNNNKPYFFELPQVVQLWQSLLWVSSCLILKERQLV